MVKKILFPIIGVLVVAGALTYYFVSKDRGDETPARPTNTINFEPSNSDDNLGNNKRKGDPQNAAQTLSNGSSNQNSESSPQTADNPANIGIVITSVQTNSTSLIVGVQTSKVTNGTCTLIVSQVGQNDIKASESVAIPPHTNNYNCPAFQIPLTSFPNRNNWAIYVTLTSGESAATSTWSSNPVNLSGKV